jgi:hypothetical protein
VIVDRTVAGSISEIIEPLQRGKVAVAAAVFEAWLAGSPSPDDFDLLLLELVGLADAPLYQKDGPAQRLRFFLMRVEECHVSSDPALDWAQTRLQYDLGLVEATQIACGVLLAFLRRSPHCIEAHRLYLDTVIEYDFFVDLGYEDRFAELRCGDDVRAALLLRWARAEYHSFSPDSDETYRRRCAQLVIDLISRAKALEPALEWRDVVPIYCPRPEWQSEAEALAQSFCAAELRKLRGALFTD